MRWGTLRSLAGTALAVLLLGQLVVADIPIEVSSTGIPRPSSYPALAHHVASTVFLPILLDVHSMSLIKWNTLGRLF